MMKIEYSIVSKVSRKLFIEEVNKMLEDGWELYGDISTAHLEEGSVRLTQAFIKKDETVPEHLV